MKTTTTALMDQQTKAANTTGLVRWAVAPIYTKHFMVVYDPGDKRETIPPTYQVFRLTDLATATVGEPAPVYAWEELEEATEFARKMDEVVEWAVKQEHLKAAIDAGTLSPIVYDTTQYGIAGLE